MHHDIQRIQANQEHTNSKTQNSVTGLIILSGDHVLHHKYSNHSNLYYLHNTYLDGNIPVCPKNLHLRGSSFQVAQLCSTGCKQ